MPMLFFSNRVHSQHTAVPDLVPDLSIWQRWIDGFPLNAHVVLKFGPAICENRSPQLESWFLLQTVSSGLVVAYTNHTASYLKPQYQLPK